MGIKASINSNQVIGTLKEMNIEEITKEVVLKSSNGTEKKVECKQIAKKVFSNPMFVVESNGNDIEIDFFPISEKKLDDNDNIVDNPRFKSFKTILDTYVPKSIDTENATRVKVDGTLRENGYPDKDYNWKSFPQINGFQITSSNVPEEDSTDSEISGVIHNISAEVKSDGTETGRLNVELYTFDNLGNGSPLKFVVESDIAEDFADFYEVGQSVKLYYETVVKQVGAKKSSSGGGFGRRESHMVSGFRVQEYSIFRGDEPFEEENEYFIPTDAVVEAKKEREFMIEKKIADKKEKDKNGGSSTTSSSPKGASVGKSNNPFGNKTETTTPKKANPFA